MLAFGDLAGRAGLTLRRFSLEGLIVSVSQSLEI